MQIRVASQLGSARRSARRSLPVSLRLGTKPRDSLLLVAQRTTRERHYKGPVEVWVDGTMQFEAEVRLTKSELVEDVETLGGTESVPLRTSWDGRFRGLATDDLRPLHARGEFELRLSDGSVGRAVLPNGRDLTYLDGLGDPPF